MHCDDGEYRAAYDECSHAQIALSEGEVDGCTLECWLHGSRFDLRTGKPSGLPATEPIPVYPVEIHDGDIYVSLVPSNGVHAMSVLSSATCRSRSSCPTVASSRSWPA